MSDACSANPQDLRAHELRRELGLPKIEKLRIPKTFQPPYPEAVLEPIGQTMIEDYHADGSSVSSTSVRLALLSKRAFLFGHVYGFKKPPSPAMNFGKAAHLALLEPALFRELHVVMPEFGDFRSSKNRDARDAWLKTLPPGAVVLSQEEFDRLRWMLDSALSYYDYVRGEYPVQRMLQGASFERTIRFTHPGTGLSCRMRPDILNLTYDAGLFPDLKTARNVSKAQLSKELWTRGYHVQLAFYALGLRCLKKESQARHPALIFVQNEFPFETVMHAPDIGAQDRGETSVELGLRRIFEGVSTGQWPGRQTGGIEDLALPAYTDYLEDGES